MPVGRTPEYRLSYDDRLIEEAWSIASSRRDYEAQGIEWKPWRLKRVTLNVADVLSDKKSGLEITVPDEQDYYWAKQAVDARMERSNKYLERLHRAKVIYNSTFCEEEYIHTVNPWATSLHPSWNGRRDGLSVDHFLFLMGIPDNQLKTIFNYTPENPKMYLLFRDDFRGFTVEGKRRLSQLVGKPMAFVHPWASSSGHGRFFSSWNLSSKEIIYPDNTIRGAA